MNHSEMGLHPTDTDDDLQLKNLGWSDEALRIRVQLIEIMQGWQASDNLDLTDLPAASELEPLVRLVATDTPAADDAAILLMLFDVGQWIAAGPTAVPHQ